MFWTPSVADTAGNPEGHGDCIQTLIGDHVFGYDLFIYTKSRNPTRLPHLFWLRHPQVQMPTAQAAVHQLHKP